MALDAGTRRVFAPEDGTVLRGAKFAAGAYTVAGTALVPAEASGLARAVEPPFQIQSGPRH